MIVCLFKCHFRHSLICFSSRPSVLAQYPFTQKRQAQYRFLNLLCLWNTLTAPFPFKKPITSEIEYFDGDDHTKWIFSICTLPFLIFTLFHSHSYLISRNNLPTLPSGILNQYLGHHTTWYSHSHAAGANLLKSFIEYFLLVFRVTYVFKRYSFYANLHHFRTRIAWLGLPVKLVVEGTS